MELIFWLEDNKNVFFQKTVSILEDKYGELCVDYFTSDDSINSCAVAGKKLNYIDKRDIKNKDYDLILVIGKFIDKNKVLQECRTFSIDDSKLLFDFEVCIPGFSVEKSNKLHRSKISIFSINNFGEDISNRFRLPYFSPFIGSVMTTEDWLTFLKNPCKYLSEPLSYYEKLTNIDGTEFGVYRMGESELKVYMLFETDVDTIQREWAERVKQINWLDVLIMMYTDSTEILDEFDRLPYAKKICFTSFESRLDSAFCLPRERDKNGDFVPLWKSVQRLADAEQPSYDLWDLLLYGRRTRIQYF